MYELDHILYVCNAGTFSQKMLISGHYFENELKQAPVIFLTHTDILSEKECSDVLKSLKEIVPDAVIHVTGESNRTDMNLQEFTSAYDSCRNISGYPPESVSNAAENLHLQKSVTKKEYSLQKRRDNNHHYCPFLLCKSLPIKNSDIVWVSCPYTF